VLFTSVLECIASYCHQVIDEESLLVVRKIENVPTGLLVYYVVIYLMGSVLFAGTSANKPKLDVEIEQCGEL
jgi:hypothetical protein